MKKLGFLLVCAACLFLTSCHTYTHSMKEPNAYVEYHADDFELSEQVTGNATVNIIFGIDWEHRFGKKEIGSSSSLGSVSIPVIGLALNGGVNYALYDMMKKNPGYDVVVYPQVETHRHAPIFGTNIFSQTTYKVTARLGKLKKK